MTATNIISKVVFSKLPFRVPSRAEQTAIAAARTVKRHCDGILQWFESKIVNGLIEGINSLVQAAKAKARGYRSTRNLKALTHPLISVGHKRIRQP